MAAAAAAPALASSEPRHAQRNNPGCRYEDFFEDFAVVPLDEIDSALGTQQYIQSLIRQDPADVVSIVLLPANQDPLLWQYEQLRQICLELNYLVTMLEEECNATTCPDMKANSWQYLCAAHEVPQNCVAIDYSVHTLDGATALLNSNKFFGSRVTISKDSSQHFESIARRLYRIFAHAYFHHRAVFDQFEAATHLHARFVKVALTFKLMGMNLMIVPLSDADEEEGDGSAGTRQEARRNSSASQRQLWRSADRTAEYSSSESEAGDGNDELPSRSSLDDDDDDDDGHNDDAAAAKPNVAAAAPNGAKKKSRKRHTDIAPPPPSTDDV
ncbi:hypothetical protein RI367_008372 [Sorochytrium milnesiophthora]